MYYNTEEAIGSIKLLLTSNIKVKFKSFITQKGHNQYILFRPCGPMADKKEEIHILHGCDWQSMIFFLLL